ncbi:MAG: site-specific integrase [Prolixibacteraceae bacterium]|nr:site-specific integrase [Prolixibacteraceae bacterium]
MNYELSILFSLKRSKENKAGEVPIYLRITVNGQRAEISTNRKVEVSKWDSDTQRVKGRSESARILNDCLDNLQNRLNRDYNSLSEKGEEITASGLRDTLIGKNVKKYFLVQVFEMNNALIKQEEGQKYTRSTIDQYTTTLVRLKIFLNQEYACNDIALSNLDLLFIRRFEIFLKTNYEIGYNTVMKHLKQLKKVIHFAMLIGYMERDPFFQHKTASKEVSRGYLSADDLSKIENHVFRIKRLDQVRDVFIFVCYTGLAYSDLKLLSRESISKGIDGKNWLIYHREKTGIRASIPLLSKALAIIEKYDEDPECQTGNKLLPIKSNQKLNSYLSEIAELCEIDKHITMHLGRHTFATTVTLTNGVPIETVSKMLGHTSIKTTQIYSKVVDTKISNDMEQLETTLKGKNPSIENVKAMRIS